MIKILFRDSLYPIELNNYTQVQIKDAYYPATTETHAQIYFTKKEQVYDLINQASKMLIGIQEKQKRDKKRKEEVQKLLNEKV